MADRQRVVDQKLLDTAERIKKRLSAGGFGSGGGARADITALGNSFVTLVDRIHAAEGPFEEEPETEEPVTEPAGTNVDKETDADADEDEEDDQEG